MPDSSEIRLDGRSVIVTGAGRGLGRSHALLLAARGASVLVADSGVDVDGDGGDTEVAESVAQEIRAAGGSAEPYSADLATEDGAVRAVDACVAAFGRVDGILHNASTVPPPATLEDFPTSDFDLCMRVNVYAGFWMTRTAWPHMVREGFGRIVYTTSGAFYGTPAGFAYAAAKTSYFGLARCLAVAGEPHGILTNVLGPSARTRMHGSLQGSAYMEWLGNTMTAEKVSVGAVFMMSDACDFNGEILQFEGGHVSRVALAENEGFLGSGESVEEVRDAMPGVLADERFIYPKNLSERMLWSARLFGADELQGVQEAWG